MNDLPDAGAPGPATEKRLVTRRRQVRRPLGAGFWLTSLVAVAALAAVTALTQRAATEEALGAAVKDALRSQTRADVGVVVQGRSVTVRVPAGANERRVTRLAAKVDGVVAAEGATAFQDAEQRRACSRLGAELDRATDEQRIPFAGETTTLTAEGSALVRSAADVLLACPVGDVVVGGHTDDDTGGGGELSLARARVILRMLEAAGVDGDRLEPRGYGDQFPLDDADTDAADQANQRGSIVAEGL